MQKRVSLCILSLLALITACTVSPTQNQACSSPSILVEDVSSTLWMCILSPVDDTIVITPFVEVQGEAAADTVLSINEEILVVSSLQTFTVSVPLEEGMNVIEIVASDYAGNEISHILTITYQP